MTKKAGGWLVAVLVAVIANGCGGPDLVPVEGVVSFNGQPLSGATVRFDRSTGPVTERSYVGETDSTGRFVLKRAGSNRSGAVPDAYRVFITSVKVPPDANERTPLPPERVPMKFRDGSQIFDVPERGTTEANFAIASR